MMLVVLLALGTWQVKRLHWKEDLIATIDQRIHLKPIDVTAILPEEANYRPVKASGTFLHDKQMHIYGMSIEGKVGHFILTPLKLKDGRYLLINRGWEPAGTPHNKQLNGTASVKGILRKPPHPGWLKPGHDPKTGLWYGIDLPAMAADKDIKEFMPYVLEADATPNKGGYPVGGQTRITFPNNHLVYAITWYALALALIIIYGLSGYRKVS